MLVIPWWFILSATMACGRHEAEGVVEVHRTGNCLGVRPGLALAPANQFGERSGRASPVSFCAIVIPLY